MTRFERDGGPIVVGGVGGSGTRLAAQMLLELGVHLGDDLNRSLDNLWFTLLLMRPRWFDADPEAVDGEVRAALTILGRALRGEALSAEETAFATAVAEETHRTGYSRSPAGAGAVDWAVGPGESWARSRLASLLAATRAAPRGATGWGWKEPNSHVFLPAIDRAFEDLRFVLVSRNGLDMAFSDNRHQLANWGARYGVVASDEQRGPRQALAFWVAANRRAIAYGTDHLRDRFLVLNYDRLCLSPEDEVQRLCRLVDREPSVELLQRLTRIPRPPASMGRYRVEDLDQLDPADVEAVRDLGFAV